MAGEPTVDSDLGSDPDSQYPKLKPLDWSIPSQSQRRKMKSARLKAILQDEELQDYNDDDMISDVEIVVNQASPECTDPGKQFDNECDYMNILQKLKTPETANLIYERMHFYKSGNWDYQRRKRWGGGAEGDVYLLNEKLSM